MTGEIYSYENWPDEDVLDELTRPTDVHNEYANAMNKEALRRILKKLIKLEKTLKVKK